MEIGSVCIKTKGRLAGKKCVVVGMEKGFAVIEGKWFKKKKCNLRHLFLTNKSIMVTKTSSHEEILKLLNETVI